MTHSINGIGTSGHLFRKKVLSHKNQTLVKNRYTHPSLPRLILCVYMYGHMHFKCMHIHIRANIYTYVFKAMLSKHKRK